MFGAMNVVPGFRLREKGAESDGSLDGAVAQLLEVGDYPEFVRWVQFPAAVLLFLMLRGDPESGAFYLFDRKQKTFYMLDFEDQAYGGYRLANYERLVSQSHLLRLVEQPWLLQCDGQWFVEPGAPLRCRFELI
jgi:hypothetical protein